MMRPATSSFRSARRQAGAAGLLVALAAGCNGDGIGPTAATTPAADSSAATAAADTSAVAPDSILAAPDSAAPLTVDAAVVLDGRSSLPGVVFGSFNMQNSLFSSVHTGAVRGGGLDASNILSLLAGAKAKGARVVLKLCNGADSFVKNADGTFSLTKWKSLVNRFASVNLNPYISDGTIIGHYLIDEPQRASKWGGKVISQATLESMAQYSKARWAGMTTFVRVVPSWLASSSVTYQYLDAGWAQYESGKGDPARWVAAEVAAAKGKGLGLAVGLNVLDGGNGSSGIPGWQNGKYAMSASEIRSYGSAMLNQSYSCAFFMWMYDGSYYGRSSIKSAMADMSTKARSHAKTSCRQ
jgi:hypothetical protein